MGGGGLALAVLLLLAMSRMGKGGGGATDVSHRYTFVPMASAPSPTTLGRPTVAYPGWNWTGIKRDIIATCETLYRSNDPLFKGRPLMVYDTDALRVVALFTSPGNYTVENTP